MTKVKLTVCRCGDGLPEVPGQVVCVSDAEAGRLIADGQAVAIEEDDEGDDSDDEPTDPPDVPVMPKPPAKRKAVKGPNETR